MILRLDRKLLLLFMMLTPFTMLSAQNQQKLTPELLWKLKRLALDNVSKDGRFAVYGVQQFDVDSNRSSRVLYRIDLESGESIALTEPDQSAWQAEFHPDGKRIGFIRKDRLYEVPLDGGAIRQVADIEIKGFHYSPDGKQIAFIRNVKLDQPASETNPDLPKTTGRVIEGLFYRHWKDWHDYQYSHLFIADYRDGQLIGTPTDVMPGERFDTPLQPSGGMEQITWSPDSKSIAYTSRKLNGTAEALSTNSDIFLYNLNSKKTENLTANLPGYDLEPAFSPDGRFLAWTSMERAGYESDRTRLMVLDLKSSKYEDWTKEWPYEANHPQWAKDGKSIYFLSANDFTYHFFEITAADRKIRRRTNGQYDYIAYQVAGTDKLIGVRQSMQQPADLFLIQPSSGKERQLTAINAPIWGSVAKGEVQRRTVKTFDGKDMNVWVILPPGFDATKKYPTLLYCQGGPQSALSQIWSYRWNFQLMAANDYVIVAPCRRGMPGSGQAWNDAIMGDWGGGPQQDLLAAIDDVAKEPWSDETRLGAVGASYGGYSVYWLAGNHQKRFKTFISHCGLFNLESFYGTTEELWFPNNDLGGPYWEKGNSETWQKDSPHRYVQNWDAPMLVIHNERDYRVPLSEGMQAFQAAQLRGIPSKFLYFPDEGHHMASPQNSILWQRTFFEWLSKTLKDIP